jgi:uncharacterized protein YcbK (DUF882 family)
MGGWRCACPDCAPDAVLAVDGDTPWPSRRRLLAATAGFAGASLTFGAAALAQAVTGGAPRALSVLRVQTGERFDGVYWREGRYVRESLSQLDWVLRDPTFDEATPMDPRLFDVMHLVAHRLGSDDAFEVISGYRAPETNAASASRSRRVSRVSLHMSGMAADVRLPDRNSLGVARLAAEMQVGGVGLYRRDGFVHLDCGPARRW